MTRLLTGPANFLVGAVEHNVAYFTTHATLTSSNLLSPLEASLSYHHIAQDEIVPCQFFCFFLASAMIEHVELHSNFLQSNPFDIDLLFLLDLLHYLLLRV